jgi:hypothetical protein
MTLYNLDSIDLQKGWTVRAFPNAELGTFDQAVVDAPGEGRVWRISNAITAGAFSNQPFTYSSCEVAGETGSFLWNNRTTPQSSAQPGAPGINKNFVWSVRFKSATGGNQTGLRIDLLSMARQYTWRQTSMRVRDTGSGFNITVQERGAFNGTSPSITRTIASDLSYTDWHTVTTKITFVDGINNSSGLLTGNDIAEVFLDGNLIYTGSTW